MSEKATANALINETSPYLLQHAHNPVNWYPWGSEAFDKAATEDKPVFLSIGYSTCHWCHVMEHESFEDLEVADFLNEYYVCIKVDKEERPDIDAVYMNVCQSLTGSGGWPMTIFMTPQKKPFYAGTYFPKTPKYGHAGLMELLSVIADKWENDKESLLNASEEITNMMSKEHTSINNKVDKLPDIECIENAVMYYENAFDKKYGGFGGSPKFPSPHNLMFLLRYHVLNNDMNSLNMVEKTLQQIYRGGIFDHIGFGFSRYSTDEKWLVPHFEKMLYDNALLAITLLETYQVTQNMLYKTVAEKTLEYISREMTSPEGGFYSAQDADSDGEEGKFYTFTPDEINNIIGKDISEQFCKYYDITSKGNFEGKSIPNLINNTQYSQVNLELKKSFQALREYRNKRTHLHKDDKILTSWNALMIIAFAKAYHIIGDEHYYNTANNAKKFICKNLFDENNNLLISYRDGKAKGKALLDDYAYLTWCYLELYECKYEVEHLANAIKFADIINKNFADKNNGYFMNANDAETLIYRPKEQYDGAMPSGNSVFAYCLAKLANLTGESKWQQLRDNQLSFYNLPFKQQPYSYSFALLALMQVVYPTKEVVCVVKKDKDNLIEKLNNQFLPNTTILIKNDTNSDELNKIAPFTSSYNIKDKDAFYVCQNQSCATPVSSVDELLLMLD